MAAVEITISGTLYDKINRTTQQVVLVGDAGLTGLGIGGGPMPPGGGGGGGGPGIPTHPIYYPPEIAGGPGWLPQPPGGGGGPHPIQPLPPGQPIGPGGTPPGSGQWEWAWSPGMGWHVAFVPGDKPQPPPVGGGGGPLPPTDLPPAPTPA